MDAYRISNVQKWLFTAVLFFFSLLFVTHSAFSVTPEPPTVPPDPVIDLAGIIKPETQKRLNMLLRELEQKTGAQFVILTVKSLDGEGIESFTLRMAERWKLGKKGKDNGMLLVVALKDKKYRFETGYGLESLLPDSFLGTLGRKEIRPHFRKGEYSAGIWIAANVIAQRIAQANNVVLNGQLRPPSSVSHQKPHDDLQELFSFIAIGIALFVLFGVIGMLMFASRVRHTGGFPSGGGYFGGVKYGDDSFDANDLFRGGGGSFGGGGVSGSWQDDGGEGFGDDDGTGGND